MQHMQAVVARLQGPSKGQGGDNNNESQGGGGPKVPFYKSAGLRKELGMLMFLLAAETVVGSCVSHQPPAAENKNGSGSGSHTAAAAIKKQQTYYHPPAVKFPPVTHIPLFDDQSAKPMKHVLASGGGVIGQVLSFLPWRDVIIIRGVAKAWLEQSAAIAAPRRMPVTGAPAVFLRYDSTSRRAKSETAAQLPAWQCWACGFYNAAGRGTCANRNCQLQCVEMKGATRMFVGQLRRDGTVPFLEWVIEDVIGERGAVAFVENHVDRVSGRGKGCAWAHIRNESVGSILGYHRRLFLDCTDKGEEGAWVVAPQHAASLAAEANSAGFSDRRPKFLPRNPLVAELPTGDTQQQEHHNNNKQPPQQQALPPPPPPPPPPHSVAGPNCNNNWNMVPPPPPPPPPPPQQQQQHLTIVAGSAPSPRSRSRGSSLSSLAASPASSVAATTTTSPFGNGSYYEAEVRTPKGAHQPYRRPSVQRVWEM